MGEYWQATASASARQNESTKNNINSIIRRTVVRIRLNSRFFPLLEGLDVKKSASSPSVSASADFRRQVVGQNMHLHLVGCGEASGV